MNNPTKEMLFRRYNLELSKFEGKIIAIGDLETEISHSIVGDIPNTSADINALGLEDFRLINVSQLGISHYTIEDGKKIEKIKVITKGLNRRLIYFVVWVCLIS